MDRVQTGRIARSVINTFHRALTVITDEIIKLTRITYSRVRSGRTDIEQIYTTCPADPHKSLCINPNTVSLLIYRTHIDVVITLFTQIRKNHRITRYAALGRQVLRVVVIQHHIITRSVAVPRKCMRLAVITYIRRSYTWITRINADIIHFSRWLHNWIQRIEPHNNQFTAVTRCREGKSRTFPGLRSAITRIIGHIGRSSQRRTVVVVSY